MCNVEVALCRHPLRKSKMRYMNYKEFIHPEDEAAMRNLEAVPGFDAVARFILEHYTEDLMHGLYMAQNVRLSPTQLPEIYNLLPPICGKFGLELPEFYLTMDPAPNAWTIGDKRKFIVITSGLLNHVTDKKELQSIIAHECGHILCRHVFYNTIAMLLVNFGESLGFGKIVLTPILLAMKYWQRRSELSADRASAVFIGDSDVPCRALLRICGGPDNLTKDINLHEYAEQAKSYYALLANSKWNKFLQNMAVMNAEHPFAAVRINELLSWTGNEQFASLKEAIASAEVAPMCPKCGRRISTKAKFCKFCGSILKGGR